MTTPAPVEISERFQAGAWTQELLQEYLGNYRDRLVGMGAPEAEIESVIRENDDGTADVIARWSLKPPAL